MTNYLDLLKILYRLKTFQHRSPAEIRNFQFARFKELLSHAYKTVPMYREFYDSQGFNIASVQTYDDLEHVPAISKDVMRAFPVHQRVDQNVSEGDIEKETTSGSTGEPFEIWTDRTESIIQAMKGVRLLLNWGYSPFHQTVQLWRQDVEPKRSLTQSLGLFRRELVSIMNEPDFIVNELKNSRCDVLFSTRSSLEILCWELSKRNVQIKPHILVSCCELLTNEQRQLFRKNFETETLEIYGCAEAGNMAWGCPVHPENLHIEVETVLVNIRDVRPSSAGHQMGNIIVTNLENFTMPFIRYDLGDLISIPENSQCSCGRNQPLLGKVIGRNDDILEYKGRKFNFHFFYNYFKNFLYINKYKIVQTKQGDIEFRIHLLGDTQDNRELCASDLKKTLGPYFSPLNIKFVEKFPVATCGKFKVLEKET